MKYAILILDGASGLPLPDMGDRTCLEIARTPNLDRMAGQGMTGTARTVPARMEPSSACACMSVMGYDPEVYYKGRAAIEAISLGIDVARNETVFRCNLVNTDGGIMNSYCSGHISTAEARELIDALNRELGNSGIRFYPGTSYRHILKLGNLPEALRAATTAPHDISGRPTSGYLPKGDGSKVLLELIEKSRSVLKNHPVNRMRIDQGKIPADSIWLTWGSGPPPEIPPFETVYGLKAALTSGVDLLKGLAKMMSVTVLDIPGVTDGQDNDCDAQVSGALEALGSHDLIIIHFEAPDEAGHAGSVQQKVDAIETADRQMVSRLIDYAGHDMRMLVMPDHPTPVSLLTHTADPVPFVLSGSGIPSDTSSRFTERQAETTGLKIDPGWHIMKKLIGN